jgi:hypothetical protein
MQELEKNNWPFVQYRNCVYDMQQKETQQLSSRACNETVCIFRLEEDGKTFTGSGYTLTFGLQDSLGLSKITLTDKDGKKTVMEQSCGASSCADAVTVSGEIRGATFKGPYRDGNKLYIVLELPVTKPRAATVVTAFECERQSKLPCSLQMKTIDYRFDISGEVSIPKQVIKDTRSIVERLKFSKTDDVYFFEFAEDRDQLSTMGYLYKFTQEIDFAVNQMRAPPHVTWQGVRFLKGALSFKDNIVTREMHSAVVQFGQTNTSNFSVKIRLSPDFRTCSVVAASWSGNSATGGYRYDLERPIECTIQ